MSFDIFCQHEYTITRTPLFLTLIKMRSKCPSRFISYLAASSPHSVLFSCFIVVVYHYIYSHVFSQYILPPATKVTGRMFYCHTLPFHLFSPARTAARRRGQADDRHNVRLHHATVRAAHAAVELKSVDGQAVLHVPRRTRS
jgi:hypothetical protein